MQSAGEELWRSLAVLAESPSEEHQRLAALLALPGAPSREAYTSLFVLQLPPYASIYTNDDGMLGGAARDRVAGFWRALGAAPPAEPDHLATLLGLYATLTEAERDAGSEDARAKLHHARRALFWEHLAAWLIVYLPRAAAIADGVYAAWAKLALLAMAAEADLLGGPETPPLALREAPALPRLEHLPADDLAAMLLAPIRSGIILTTSDLQRAARETGLGVRVGERRFALRHLLSQDAFVIFDWLRAEVDARAEEQAHMPAILQSVAQFWAERARQCARDLPARVADRFAG